MNRRGRSAAKPPAAQADAPKTRGRPKKAIKPTEEAPKAAIEAPKRRRRPKKATEPPEEPTKSDTPKGRGRRTKASKAAEEPPEIVPEAPKRRGRPTKAAKPAAEPVKPEAPKRSLKRKADEDAHTTNDSRKKRVTLPTEESTESKESPKAEKRRRKVTKHRAKGISSSPSSSHVAPDGAAANATGSAISYWLMKAEPESRIENGVDVKFSIDDLQAAKDPEPWDGVRNHVAKNNMVAMKKGDLAFFYHSNCKIPGIAGTMEIVQEATPDQSAFDAKHPYYDPKSNRNSPKWFNVHVAFRSKFKNFLPLNEIKAHGGPGGALQSMDLIRQSRLSVGKVSEKEWDFLIDLAGEGIGTSTPHTPANPPSSASSSSSHDRSVTATESGPGSIPKPPPGIGADAPSIAGAAAPPMTNGGLISGNGDPERTGDGGIDTSGATLDSPTVGDVKVPPMMSGGFVNGNGALAATNDA